MPEHFKKNRVPVSAAAADAVTVIRMAPLQSTRALLYRLGVESEEGLPKEVYATALYDALCEDREQVLTIFPRELIRFLIEIWEKDYVEMDERRWEYVRYLSVLGFAYFQKGNELFGSADMLFYVENMKEEFYFLLKSRGSQTLIRHYDEWDGVLSGLLYYYGVIELSELSRIFNMVLGENVVYSEFDEFMLKRCSFWAVGTFLRSADGQTQYFQHMNAEDSGTILMNRERYKLPWFIPDKDSCVKLYSSGGMDNRWKGFTDLVKLLSDKAGMDYYQTSVLVRTLIRLIQNGCELEALLIKLDGIPFTEDGQTNKAREALTVLYEEVPVFHLKGYNRAGHDLLKNEKQLKKRRKLFTMIEGGKLS